MKTPLPLFDQLKYIDEQLDALPVWQHPNVFKPDYAKALTFLKTYRGSTGTFNAYRREVERFLHWSSLYADKKLKDIQREDIEAFIEFCQSPPKEWIGVKKSPRFLNKEAKRAANPEWRPFVVVVPKTQHKQGKRPNVNDFELSQGSIRELFAILSTFFTFLVQEEYVRHNPVALVRQKSKFIRSSQAKHKIRRLSELQWQYVIQTAKEKAEKMPEDGERTLFLLSLLYALYLRISEVVENERWQPKMNDFHRDHEGLWWFNTLGKGNKERQIAVSDSMLQALKRWRSFLGLSSLPSPADASPLLPRQKGKGGLKSTHYVRELIQDAFDSGALALKKEGFSEESETLLEATVHWLRHTGISDDVKHRPREHVRDDAGHSSSAITDKYIDIELRERHLSAKKKQIQED